MPESLQPLAVWLVQHTYLVVFVAALIDSTGIPFPGRLILVAAGAFSARGDVDPIAVMLAGAVGVAITDHLWYFTGALGADRVVRAFCRWTLNSELSPRKTADWFDRFGPLTIVAGRFFAGVRLLAWPLARPHGVGYRTFVLFDALGSLLWSGVWVGLGWALGDHALDAAGDAGWVGIAIAGIGVVVVLSLRVWRRRPLTWGPRNGPQTP
ncbi:MAG TPA: DedA family protein [Methylomirabilota bacterium]|jgi:membrane protein DedA with SNARE-associated domain